ncbi:hypothetical protein MASR2M12_06270 [Bacteroidales bacterium]
MGVINNYQFMNTLEQPGRCDLFIEISSLGIGKYSDDNFEHIYGECKGTGFEVNTFKNEVKLYPNPAALSAWVELPEKDIQVSMQVQLIGPTGRRLYEAPAKGRFHQIALEH